MSAQALANVAFVVLLLTLGVLYLLLVVPRSGRSAHEALADAPVGGGVPTWPVDAEDRGISAFIHPGSPVSWDAFDARRCVICGCTDGAPCTEETLMSITGVVGLVPCSWVGGLDEDLCTSCLSVLGPAGTRQGAGS